MRKVGMSLERLSLVGRLRDQDLTEVISGIRTLSDRGLSGNPLMCSVCVF